MGSPETQTQRVVIVQFPQVYSLGLLFSDVHECNEKKRSMFKYYEILNLNTVQLFSLLKHFKDFIHDTHCDSPFVVDL